MNEIILFDDEEFNFYKSKNYPFWELSSKKDYKVFTLLNSKHLGNLELSFTKEEYNKLGTNDRRLLNFYFYMKGQIPFFKKSSTLVIMNHFSKKGIFKLI